MMNKDVYIIIAPSAFHASIGYAQHILQGAF